MAIYTDSATVRVAVTPSGVSSTVYVDAATVYYRVIPSAVEKHDKPDFTGEGQAFAQYSVIPYDETLLLYEGVYVEQYTAKLKWGN